MAELNEEEGKMLVEAFNKLKVKPKFDTSDDLENWLTAYHAIKPDPGVDPKEIKCLIIEKTYKPEIILQAVRRSVRGEAGNLVRRLGTGASIIQILEKIESVYGEVDTKEHLLAKFYSARQEESEDVTKWSCRLEDIL